MTTYIRTIGFMGPDAEAAGRPQAFKRRDPVWWKMYGDLFDRWATLPTDTDRCHLVALWQLAARLGNKIPNDPHWIQHEAGLSELPDLDALESAGLIWPVGPRARAHARREGELIERREGEDLSARPRVAHAREREIPERRLSPNLARRVSRERDVQAARSEAAE